MKKRSSDDFATLTSFLEQVKSYTPDLIFVKDPSQALYHYTDLGGLQGILQNDDLWLTHSRYLNDDEEITHGYRIVKTVIEEEQNKPKLTKERQKFLAGLFELVKEPSEEGVYICSFCLDDNLLSQWRGYGANGMGVSLKFDPSGFSYITGGDSPKNGLMRLWKVFYPADTQKEIIRQAINFGFKQKVKTVQEKADKAAYAIQFFIPTFKNAGFVEEKECRLIFTPSPDFAGHPRFRVARGMLIPYYSLKELTSVTPTARKLPLTGVRVGPSSNKRLNVESTRMVLNQTGYSVRVDVSETSFRGM
jgi:hypothetical protein